jgi:hypothetical protein
MKWINYMTFDSTVSERDKGVKVIDFQIKVASDQPEQPDTLISEMERLVIRLKERATQNLETPVV